MFIYYLNFRCFNLKYVIIEELCYIINNSSLVKDVLSSFLGIIMLENRII
jgi:hypothetical protein